jgi:catechol 2,3-dioxygenase-like lactoylglutathione lyase family enzyme
MKGKVTGVGGIFFKSRDPAALAAWYRERLGIDVQSWGGAAFRWREGAPDGAGTTVWSPFKHDTTYFEPGTKDFMINLRVDDLDAMVAELEAKGIAILGRQDEDYGRFAWILDPDGVKVELWQQLGPAPE